MHTSDIQVGKSLKMIRGLNMVKNPQTLVNPYTFLKFQQREWVLVVTPTSRNNTGGEREQKELG